MVGKWKAEPVAGMMWNHRTYDVAIGTSGNVHINDNCYYYRIRKVLASTGMLFTIVGGGTSYNTDNVAAKSGPII